jgi:hypothetical protein
MKECKMKKKKSFQHVFHSDRSQVNKTEKDGKARNEMNTNELRYKTKRKNHKPQQKQNEMNRKTKHLTECIKALF